MPQTPDEALAVIDLVLADEHLHALVAATRANALDPLRRYVLDRGRGLGAADREQIDRVAQQWQRVGRLADPIRRGPSRAEGISWLGAFARHRWDLRCGRERDRIPAEVELLPPDLAAVVDALAVQWGMVGPLDATGEFDAAVILAGFVESNLHRAAAAAQLLQQGSVSYPMAVGLASARPLPAAEQARARHLGAAGRTEADTMARAMAKAFGADPVGWQEGEFWLQQARDDGLRLVVTQVPMRSAGSRPNTGEAFSWLLACRLLPTAPRLLCLTTPLYRIQNHCNVLTRLPPERAALVTAGAQAAAQGCPPPRYRSQHYLQEIKSAIDVLPALYAWATS